MDRKTNSGLARLFAEAQEERERLRKARSHSKGLITRLQNQLKELMWDLSNIEEVRCKVDELVTALRKFRAVHLRYHAKLDDEDEIEDSREYYAREEQKVNDMLRTIDVWIITAQTKIQQETVELGIRPEDSVSHISQNSRSTVSSKAKAKSTLRKSASLLSENSKSLSSISDISDKIKEKAAKKAALEEELSLLKSIRATEKELSALKSDLARAESQEHLEKESLSSKKVSKNSLDKLSLSILPKQPPEEKQSTNYHKGVQNETTGTPLVQNIKSTSTPNEEKNSGVKFSKEPDVKSHSVPLNTEENTGNPLVQNTESTFTSNEGKNFGAKSSMEPDVKPRDLPLNTEENAGNRPVQNIKPPSTLNEGSSFGAKSSPKPDFKPSYQSLNPNVAGWQPLEEQQGLSVQHANQDYGTVYYYPDQTQSVVNSMAELLRQQVEQTVSLTLPQPDLPVFSGDPIEYNTFIRAFESLIEAKTSSSSSRLFYLIQYTDGDVKELMRSCLSMEPNQGYKTT